MDAEKQKMLNLIADCLEEGGYDDAEDIDFLLKIVREQDELLTSHAPNGHNYTNGQYVWLELENEKLKKQLTKYGRVIEASKGAFYGWKIGDNVADPMNELRKALAELEE